MKRFLIVALLCCLLTGFLWARGGGQTGAAADGPVTITLLQRQDPISGDYKTKGLYKFILDKFNIDLDVNFVANDPFTERERTAILSGDLPDFVAGTRLSVAEVNQYGMDGMFYNMNDLLHVMPMVKKFLEEYPYTKNALTAADGNRYHFLGGYDTPVFYGGMGVQNNMLEDVGFDLSTVDDFDDHTAMFQALKKANGGDPVMSSRSGTTGIMSHWMASVGLTTGGITYDDAKDTFFYPFTSPDSKFVIGWMANLYAEGILHPDIIAHGEDTWEPEMGLLKWPAFIDCVFCFGYNHEERIKAEDPSNPIDYRAVKPPKYNGKQVPWRTRQVQGGEGYLNAATEHAEKIGEMIDYFRTDEGHAIGIYGMPGEDHVMIDGLPRLLYKITGNVYKFPAQYESKMKTAEEWTEFWPNGWGYIKIAGDPAQKMYQISGEHLNPEKKYGTDYFPVYSKIYTAAPAPAVPFLETDSEELISLRNALDTASEEAMAKILTGLAPLSEWDTLQTQLKSIGVDRYVELYNKSYAATK